MFDHPAEVKATDVEADATVAERVEEAGAVLLKKAEGQLPLNTVRIRSIALIGMHADVGVLSGGGSGQVDPVGGNAVPVRGNPRLLDLLARPVWDPSSPLHAIRAMVPKARVHFDPGTDVGSATRLAAKSDIAIVFASQLTHEGADLENLVLPGNQDELINHVAAANPLLSSCW